MKNLIERHTLCPLIRQNEYIFRFRPFQRSANFHSLYLNVIRLCALWFASRQHRFPNSFVIVTMTRRQSRQFYDKQCFACGHLSRHAICIIHRQRISMVANLSRLNFQQFHSLLVKSHANLNRKWPSGKLEYPNLKKKKSSENKLIETCHTSSMVDVAVHFAHTHQIDFQPSAVVCIFT